MATLITSFEVLSQPVAPGIPDVPYVQQGFFLEVSNVGPSAAQVEVEFTATPAFVTKSGAATLFVNFINQAGTPTQVPIPFFLDPPVGCGNETIPAGATWLFGVQYVLLPGSTNMVGGTPQDSFGTRGTVSIAGSPGSKVLLLATTRQVFNNYNSAGTLIDVAESAYSMPIVNGPLLTF